MNDLPQAEADRNRRMFDAIARRYDLLNRLMSLGLDRVWRRRAVAELLAGAGEPQRHEGTKNHAGPGPLRFLDVGCGTCDVILELARQAPAARIEGLDHSAAMLAAGREKVRRAGLEERVQLREGSALALPFAPGSFDGLVTAFCFRNLAERPAFAREAHRVLRPGAPLAILELTRPVRAPLRGLHRAYNGCVVPLLGRLLSQGSAYRYLFESIQRFPPRDEVTALLRAAGFDPVRWRLYQGGIVTLFLGLRGQAA